MSDYIDRAALGIGLCNRDVFENKGYADGWNAAVKILKEAPAADVQEIKHGKWIEDGYCDIPCVCSCCGAEAQLTMIGKKTYALQGTKKQENILERRFVLIAAQKWTGGLNEDCKYAYWKNLY